MPAELTRLPKGPNWSALPSARRPGRRPPALTLELLIGRSGPGAVRRDGVAPPAGLWLGSLVQNSVCPSRPPSQTGDSGAQRQTLLWPDRAQDALPSSRGRRRGVGALGWLGGWSPGTGRVSRGSSGSSPRLPSLEAPPGGWARPRGERVWRTGPRAASGGPGPASCPPPHAAVGRLWGFAWGQVPAVGWRCQGWAHVTGFCLSGPSCGHNPSVHSKLEVHKALAPHLVGPAPAVQG